MILHMQLNGRELAREISPGDTLFDFLRGEGETAVGVRLRLEPATDTLTALATRVVSQSLRPDGTLDVLFLRTEDVPAWRSEALDEAQAYAAPLSAEELAEIDRITACGA